MTFSEALGYVISAAVILALWVGLMLLLRRIVWWYWGIDKMIDTLRSIDESLRQMPAVRDYDAQGQRQNNRAV
jgi:hypothetical protein